MIEWLIPRLCCVWAVRNSGRQTEKQSDVEEGRGKKKKEESQHDCTQNEWQLPWDNRMTQMSKALVLTVC